MGLGGFGWRGGVGDLKRDGCARLHCGYEASFREKRPTFRIRITLLLQLRF